MTDPRTVVGVAIVRHGRVLAARRTARVDGAGRWELPGGKVEAGETEQQAAVREIGEELGCRVRVGSALRGHRWLPSGYVLRAHLATLAAGEPTPNGHDHDAIRWLGPEEVDEVPWQPADRTFLPGLREVLLDGEELAGGNVGGATRVGMTVRRPQGTWSPAVHRLLEFLSDAGLDAIPEVLGEDARGRETLTYLPGRGVAADGEIVSDALLRDATRWLRRFHLTVEGLRPAEPLAWRNGSRALAADEVICHHDPGVYNWVVHGDRFAGMLDWDMAGPGHPLDDLAFMAWTAVPLSRDAAVGDVARRLRLMADAYEDDAVDAAAVLHRVDARMSAATTRIADGQRRGDPGMVNLSRAGEPDRTRRRLDALRQRAGSILAALGTDRG